MSRVRNVRRRCLAYFLRAVSQLVTTVRGCTDPVAATLIVLMRKRFPSAVTEYSNCTDVFARFCDPATETSETMRASNNATGAAGSKEGLAPDEDFFIATLIIFPSAA